MLYAKDVVEEVAPFAGDSGLCPKTARDRIYREVSEGRRLLWNRGDWEGLIEYGALNVVEGNHAVLPWHLAHVRNAWVGKYPIQIKDRWYETLSFAGIVPVSGDSCSNSLIDTGKTVPFANEWPKGTFVKIQPLGDCSDEGEIEFVTRDSQGVKQTESFKMTDTVVGQLPVHDIICVKKPVTTNAFRIYSTIGGVDTEMAIYHPEQTDPSYSLYKLVGSSCNEILVRAKKRFYPIYGDNTPLGIENVVAIQFAMQAKQAQRRNNLEEFAGFLRAAEENLEEDIEEVATNPFVPLDIMIEGAVENLQSRRAVQTIRNNI